MDLSSSQTVSHTQMVTILSIKTTIFLWFSYGFPPFLTPFNHHGAMPGEAKVPPIGVVTCRSSPRGHMIVASARDPMVMGKAWDEELG